MSGRHTPRDGDAGVMDPVASVDDLLLGAVDPGAFPVAAAEVAERARRAGREGEARLAEVLALDLRARAEGPAGAVDDARAHLRWATEHGEARLACHCHALLAMTEVMLGRPGAGAEHATSALALAGAEPPRVLVRLLTRQAVGLFVCGLVDAGFDVTERAVRLSDELDDPDLVAQLAANAVQAAVESGRTTDAERWTSTLLDAARRVPGLREEMADVVVRGLLAGGRPDLALRELAWADEQGRDAVEADGKAVWLLLRAQACRGVGRLPEARELVARASALAEAASLADLATSLLEEEAALAAAEGDYALAYEHHRRFHAESRAQWVEASTARVGELLAQQRLADAIQRADRAEEASNTDALTGVRSRRWVQAELPALLRAAARHDGPAGLAIVDVDHFKAVNDRWGHHVGDEVLVDVATALLRAPGVAHAARLGGEEFLLVLPGPEQTWHAVTEVVRAGVSSLRWPASAPGLQVSVSIGVAAAEVEDPLTDTLRRADRRLYRAKTAGRDRSVGPWSFSAEGAPG